MISFKVAVKDNYMKWVAEQLDDDMYSDYTEEDKRIIIEDSENDNYHIMEVQELNLEGGCYTGTAVTGGFNGEDYDVREESFSSDNGDIVLRCSDFKDEDQNIITEGDILEFAYGIPIIRAYGLVKYQDSSFIVHTPKHKPKKIILSEFIELCGGCYIVGHELTDAKYLRKVGM